MVMKIIPYKQGSASAKALSEALGIKQLKQEGSRFRGKEGDIVINWGSSGATHPAFNGAARVLNNPNSVATATNKLESFRAFRAAGVNIPQFTNSRNTAQGWLDEGKTVVVRTKLTGHSGEGIIIREPQDQQRDPMQTAPLYTVYIKKTQEYRLHVFQGQVFFQQRKARRHDVPDDAVNWQVRNHGNGFIFAHQDVQVPAVAAEQAIRAVAALGLDFGAVDLIKTKNDNWYVLEVNTACGLEGTTLERYTEMFQRLA